MNITVYLGANEGNDPRLRKSVEELGAWIGSSGNALVYGGSKSGLMGAIAETGKQYIIGYITHGMTEKIKLEKNKWYKVEGEGNLTMSPVNVRVE